MSPSAFLVLLLVASTSAAAARRHGEPLLKSKTFLSAPISLRPGSVSNKWYHGVSFPRGHVALKSFNGELVDARGAPVPLHETYLHHWLVSPYYYPAAAADDAGAVEEEEDEGRRVPRPNAGVCGGELLGQFFGLGAETRRTATWVPDPYAVEIGDPPAGYEERWALNVHAIDTRGAVDGLGCAECRCDLYNVTAAAGAAYAGGAQCCYDQARCRVEEGFADGQPRTLFLRYTVMWVDWTDVHVVPVRIYILDVTDTSLLDGKSQPDCKVEYTVEECSAENRERNECVDVKVTKEVVPRGGDIVYAVGHQHAGGIGASLHGEDGRLLCWSTPTYGDGEEAGNEAGYVVGMSTCYPEPGTVKVRDGEALTVVSNYTVERRHTGVMGHFYLLIADEQEEQPQQQLALNKQAPSSSLCFGFPVSWCVPEWLSGYM